MSYALILSDLGDGRYSVQLDWGQATKNALLASIAAALAQANSQLAQAQANLTIEEGNEAAARATISDAIEGIIAETDPNDPGFNSVAAKAAIAIFDFTLKEYSKLLAKNQPLRDTITKTKLLIADYTRQQARWNGFVATETRNVWCTTLTEGASSYVATIEINGVTDHILLAPGARSPVLATDGLSTPTDFMSPEQAYFNFAILPGWQKFVPTYRTGTITAINEEANTASVTLAPATSPAQGLGINLRSSFTHIPVNYLNCHAAAFDVGDSAVVRIDDEEWNNATIIGFVTDPKPCILSSVYVYRDDKGGGGNTGPDILLNSYLNKVDGFHVPDQEAPAVGGVGVFLGWYNDDNSLITTSTTLPGFDIESGVTPSIVRATYYMPGRLWLGYDAGIVVDDAFHTEWEFIGMTGGIPPVEVWHYDLYCATTWKFPIAFASDSLLSSRFIPGSGICISVSHTDQTFVGADTLVAGSTVYSPPVTPGEQYEPEGVHGSILGRVPIASYVPSPVLGTIYGSVTYALEAAYSESLASYLPVSIS